MVLITRAEHQRLAGEPHEDAADIAAADRILAENNTWYPAEVVDAMLAGATPLAAWRKHKGLSQAALASAAGIRRAALFRLEKVTGEAAGVDGRIGTRRALASALGVPLSALDPLDD